MTHPVPAPSRAPGATPIASPVYQGDGYSGVSTPFAFASRSVDRSAFKKKRQHGYRKTRCNPSAFCALPEGVATSIGFWTHKGARIETAALSRFVYAHQIHAEGTQEIDFVGEGPFEVPDGFFLLSMETIARDLSSRWFHSHLERSDFSRLYERVRDGVKRLIKKGFIVRGDSPHQKSVFGSLWTFRGTILEDVCGCRQLLYRGYTITSDAARGEDVGDGHINAVDLVGGAFVNAWMPEYTQSEIITDVRHRSGRGSWADHQSWQAAIARQGAPHPRFTTVGAWRRGEEGRADVPVFLPYIVLDIDRGDVWDAFQDACAVVGELDLLGCDLSDVIVSFTGKKGFHVRIPAGCFGNPVWRGRDEVRKVLQRFVSRSIGIEVDKMVLDPRQPVRLIGSYRPETNTFCRAWLASDFLQLTTERVLVQASSFAPVSLPDPRLAKPATDLILEMVGASDTTRIASMPAFAEVSAYDWSTHGDGNGSVVRAALAGVATGEEWHPSKGGQCYVGGSLAMFIACSYLLRKHRGNERKAWEEALEVNKRYTPPFPVDHAAGQTLRGRFRSALNAYRKKNNTR